MVLAKLPSGYLFVAKEYFWMYQKQNLRFMSYEIKELVDGIWEI